MIASLSCCRFVGCTSMMRLSRSTTSQRCFIWLRSGDCGGHLSKVNTLSCSRNQSEMISALRHGVVYCWKKPSEDGYTVVIKGWTWSATISPAPLHHHHQPEPLRQGRMDPCFHVLYTKFWLYHLNAAEIKTHQIRQRFINLLLSNFGEPVWIVASVSCSYLTGVAPGVVFCCCSPSASGFDVLCIQRWYSTYLGCNEWLFELLLLSSLTSLSILLWHQKCIFVHITAAHWIFYLFRTVLCKS